MSIEAQQAPPYLVSVVVLSFNSADYLPECLMSLAASQHHSFEIIVVDNASHDGSSNVVRQVQPALNVPLTLIQLKRNMGCAGGNNVGWKHARSPIIVFANPDTELTPDCLRILTKPFETDPKIGITGAKIYYPGSRRLQHAGGMIHPNCMTEHYGAGHEDRGQFDRRSDVAYVTGAAFAIRRNLLEELRGFDEDFFPAYYEETDLCTRVRKAGYRVIYVPGAILYHHESVSLEAQSPAFMRLYNRMRIRYSLKHLKPTQWLTQWLPFELWWMLRVPAARGNRKRQLRAYWEGLRWLVGKRFRPTSR